MQGLDLGNDQPGLQYSAGCVVRGRQGGEELGGGYGSAGAQLRGGTRVQVMQQPGMAVMATGSQYLLGQPLVCHISKLLAAPYPSSAEYTCLACRSARRSSPSSFVPLYASCNCCPTSTGTHHGSPAPGVARNEHAHHHQQADHCARGQPPRGAHLRGYDSGHGDLGRHHLERCLHKPELAAQTGRKG